MTKNSIALIAVISLAAVFTASPTLTGLTAPTAPQTSAADAQLATIKQYCAGCHNDRAKTGGRVIYLTRSQPVPPAMESIRQELSRQYYLGYYTTRKPGFHSLRVEVPGRDVRIRAKRGFYSS